MSGPPQAPKEAGVAEYIVLIEVVREAHSRFQVQMEIQRQFMLPTLRAMRIMAFPPLTPASDLSTQELRVPTTYQVGLHMDQ